MAKLASAMKGHVGFAVMWDIMKVVWSVTCRHFAALA